MEIPRVRFDDLSPGGSGSFGLAGHVDTHVARRLDDVIPVLRAAEAAAIEGYWVAGYVSYEAAPALNPVLTVRPSGLHDPMRDLPLARFQVFSNRIELEEIDFVDFAAGAYNVSAWNPDSSRSDYRDSLATIGRAIMSGEIARGKHTFRLHAAFNGDPAALYRDLLQSQRGPNAVCMDVGRFRLVSASPERFFQRVGDRVTVRPVLASVRRGRWLAEDAHLTALLVSKGESSYSNRAVIKEIEAELAELGEPMVVAMEDRLAVERLETMWHLTAEIGVKLAPGVDLTRIFQATFPPVSVTGVPKPEAMDLVTRTEDTPRGAYCGVIGYLAPPGSGGPDASFGVAIRTVVIDQEEGVAEFGVGTAITNSSDVISAYEEARLKAKILVDRRPEFQLCESMRVEDKGVQDREFKIGFVLDSARYFGFDIVDGRLEGVLDEAAATAPPGSCLTVFYSREGDVRVTLTPAPPWSASFEDARTATAVVAEQTVSTDNVFLFHNTTDQRLRDAVSRQHPGVEVIVLANQYEEIAGAVGANIVAMIDGAWLTPSQECGALGGALRARLLDDGTISEGLITRDQLLASENLAVLNDIQGWLRIALAG